MSNKKITDKKSQSKISDDAELRLAEEDEIEVLPISGDESEDDNITDDECGVQIVEVGEKEDAQQVTLFESDVLIDRVEHEHGEDLGKSFRSKDLNETDLTERENMPTLEDQWNEVESNNNNVSWVNRFVFAGILLVVVAGIWAFNNLDEEEVIKEQREKELKELALQSKQNEEAYAENKAKIAECVRGYLEATTIEDRAKWCRNTEETLLKMTNHYGNELTFANYHFEGIAESSVIDILKNEVTVVAAKVSGLSGEVASQDKKMLLLEQQSDGAYRVDWETAVVYQPSDWDEFIKTKSTEPHVFRIEAKDRIDYGPYLYAFSDDNKFQAYRIGLRNEAEKFLIAYARKDSDIDKKMKELVKKSDKKKTKSNGSISLTLSVVFPNDAESDQCVEIVEIVSETWFVP